MTKPAKPPKPAPAPKQAVRKQPPPRVVAPKMQQPAPALPAPVLNPNGRVLYFAYGSNMDEVQMTTRCPASVPLWPAVLDGYRIEFVGFSHKWNGGVATVVRDAASSVDGYVFDCTLACVRRLDVHEGAPFVYSRDEIVMLDYEGERHNCVIYVHNRPQLCKPSAAYADQIRRAYHAEGFDTGPLQAAIDRAPLHVPARARTAEPFANVVRFAAKGK